MPDRPRLPLVFGSGLDRATGVLGTDPRSMRDLRNVYLYRGKAQARKGHSVVNSFLDDGGLAVQDVVLIHPMQAEQIGVVVGYQDTDRELHVYRVSGDGIGTNRIGSWFTLAASAHEPPRAFAAESYRKMFLAHDETRFNRRAQTFYYDPFDVPQLRALTANLGRGSGGPEGAGVLSVNGAHAVDATTISVAKAAGVNWNAKEGDIITFQGDPQQYAIAADVTVVQDANTNVTITPGLEFALVGGEAITVRANVRFRGVTRYLNYAVGWGYGTGADPDRAEIVRVSLPGNPLEWKAPHYFIAGLGDDPVLNCLPTNDRLIVFKGAEQYEIVGYSRQTFGIKPGDRLYGLAGSRLGVSINGMVYFWSLEGPRRTQGGQSVDLAWPLDIDAPAPSDLAAEGVLEDGVAVYLPGRRVIKFIFGAREYNLSIWNPEDPKWSYGELGVPAFSGGLLYSGGEAQSSAPVGFASAVSGTGKVGTTDTLTVDWTNNDQEGDEIVEIWLRPTGGVFELEASVAVGGATQQHDVPGLSAGTAHEIALRYRRGPFYTAGYESDDPDNWPAVSKGTGTTLLDAPTLDATDWERTSSTVERGNITFTPAHANVDVIVRRDAIEIATVTAAQHGGAQFVYNDEGIAPEANNAYDCLHRTPDADSPLSADITQWGGPDQPTTLGCSQNCASPAVEATWVNGDATLVTEVHSRNITQSLPYELSATVGAGFTSTCVTPPGSTTGDTVAVNARHKQTSFTVDDFSAFTNGTNDPQPDECSVVVP